MFFIVPKTALCFWLKLYTPSSNVVVVIVVLYCCSTTATTIKPLRAFNLFSLRFAHFYQLHDATRPRALVVFCYFCTAPKCFACRCVVCVDYILCILHVLVNWPDWRWAGCAVVSMSDIILIPHCHPSTVLFCTMADCVLLVHRKYIRA